MIDGIIVETTTPATGPRGPRGYDGADGADGSVVGYTITNAEDCSTQGYRVTITIDEGLPSEYSQWFEVCDGKVGESGKDGLNSLVNVIETEFGCIEIQVGLDINGNGELDEDEVTNSGIVCDGIDGVDGQNGQDGTDGTDGQDGANGYTSLVQVQPLINGCVLITSGIDFNGNGIIDYFEVTGEGFVCDGIDGQNGADGQDGSNGSDGTNGLTSLVDVSNKDEGGCVTITSGLDLNGNLILEEGEVTNTQVICDGANGLNGVDGIDGIDGINGTDGQNGSDGSDGYTTLVQLVEDGSCVDINVGLDVNNDGTLQEGEITSTTTICDGEQGPQGEPGEDGADGLVIGECGYANLDYTLAENYVFINENFNADLPENWIFDNFELKNSNDWLTTATAFEDYGWRAITTDYIDQVFSIDVISINLRSGLSGSGEQTVRIVLEFERNDGTVIRSEPREVDVNSSTWTPVSWESESICVRRFSILFEGDEALEVDDIYVEGTKVLVNTP